MKQMEINEKNIAKKLADVEAFEAKWGPTTSTIAWRKWCTNKAYRDREQDFRKTVIDLVVNSFV